MYDKVILQTMLTREETKQITLPNERMVLSADNIVQRIGNIKHLRVSINEQNGYTKIETNVPKFLSGDNIGTLSRVQTEQAFKQMSEMLCLNVFEMKVRSFEFGKTHYLTDSVETCLQSLGCCKGYKRDNTYKGSLYYKQDRKRKLKEVRFYDKVLECKSKGISIPEFLQDTNLLRYEIAYKNISETFGKGVTAKTMCEKGFYETLINKYLEFYDDITKTNIECMITEKSTAKDIANAVIIQTAMKLANVSKAEFESLALANLNELRNTHEIKRSEYISRARTNLRTTLSRLNEEKNVPQSLTDSVRLTKINQE